MSTNHHHQVMVRCKRLTNKWYNTRLHPLWDRVCEDKYHTDGVRLAHTQSPVCNITAWISSRPHPQMFKNPTDAHQIFWYVNMRNKFNHRIGMWIFKGSKDERQDVSAMGANISHPLSDNWLCTLRKIYCLIWHCFIFRQIIIKQTNVMSI